MSKPLFLCSCALLTSLSFSASATTPATPSVPQIVRVQLAALDQKLGAEPNRGEAAKTDFSKATMDEQLVSLMAALKTGDRAAIQAALDELIAGNASSLAIEIARVQLAAIDQKLLRSPAKSVNSKTLFLSDRVTEEAMVGYLEPCYNRLPTGTEPPLFRVGDQYFAHGIYAYAPARHVYALGGKWLRFTGAAGVLRTKTGKVGFTIFADGKEIWKSKPLNGTENAATFDLSVKDVQSLELVTDNADDGTNSDWGLWLDPQLAK